MNTWFRLSRQDLSASIVVLLVALPLCMGVAIASGMPPSAGIITGIVGGLLVGSLTGSPLQVSGPAAGLTVLVWNIAAEHGVAMVGAIVLLAGILQAGAGLLGFGRLFRAISPAVVSGMLSGIGLLIIASQWRVMVDAKPLASGLANVLAMPGALALAWQDAPGTSHRAAAGLGLLSILAIVAWSRWKPRRLALVPAPLVAVLLATGAAAVFDANVHYIDVPDDFASAIAIPSVANLSRLLEPSSIVTAVSLAVIASAETLLCAGAIDRMQDKVRTHYDRELFAQGVGNAVCGVLGALPLTGVIVRSSANVGAGAETRASTMLHGLWLLAVVLFLPDVLRMIPIASLAGVLVHTGFKLLSPAQVRELRAFGWQSVGIYAATLAGVVATDLLTGVLIGMGLSIVRLLARLASIRLDVEQTGMRVDAYLHGAVTFVSLPRLVRLLEQLPHAVDLHVHVEGVLYIDHACIVAIEDFEQQRRKAGDRIHIAWRDLEARSEKVSEDSRDLVAAGR